MNRVVFQPAGGSVAQRHCRDTGMRLVPLGPRRNALGPHDDALVDRFPAGRAAAILRRRDDEARADPTYREWGAERRAREKTADVSSWEEGMPTKTRCSCATIRVAGKRGM